MQSSLFSRLHLRRMLGPLMALALTLLLVATSVFGEPIRLICKDQCRQRRLAKFSSGTAMALRQGRRTLYAGAVCRSGMPILQELLPAAQGMGRPEPRGEPAMAPSAAPHARASRNTTGPAGRMCGRGRGPRRVLAGGHWIYQQTRSDGAGIPENMQYPALSPEIQTCLGQHTHRGHHSGAGERRFA